MFYFHFHFLLLSLVYAYTTCPPFWCCSLYRCASGCKRQLYYVYVCTRTLLHAVQDSHLLCDWWVLLLLLLLHYYGGCCCIFLNILKVMWYDVLLHYYGGCCCIFLNILKVMFMLCVWHFQNHWVKNFMLRWRTSWKTMFKVCMR